MENDSIEKTKKEIGKRAREIRNYLELSLDQFAQVCEKKPKYINRIENGGSDIRVSTVESLIKNIDMTKSEFFDYENIPESLKTFREKKLKRKYNYLFKRSKK